MKTLRAWYNYCRRFIVDTLIDSYTLGGETLSPQAELGLLSQLWENPTFRKYLTLREDYLMRQSFEKFLEGSLARRDGLAGQVVELRELRNRARAAYNVVAKQRSEPARAQEQSRS